MIYLYIVYKFHGKGHEAEEKYWWVRASEAVHTRVVGSSLEERKSGIRVLAGWEPTTLVYTDSMLSLVIY